MTRMDKDKNGRRPEWKMTKKGRQPKLKTTKIKDTQNGR